ncbi:UreD-domain-containing protein [Russula earlei]|uniref:UreD-domain-containing protein n=1 Tax=Russula earlei TaxID=71964 RepID=A0ACC0UMQ9_9AGAM|nr:UreD-domain-containing protein [Russula earlei]
MSNIGQDAGHGKIRAQIHNNRVVFPVLSYTYPLKLLSPRMQQEGVAVVYMMTYGGGLVGGDSIFISIEIEQDARLVLLSQGSTKVFKARPGGRAAVRAAPSSPNSPNVTTTTTTTTTQRLDVSIATGGALFMLPDPVTCFRDAAYRQVQTFRLARGASAVLLDWYTSGRRARGEEWAFTKYYSSNEVFVDGVRTARDVVLLDGGSAARGQLLPRRALADRMGPYACYATVLLYGPVVQGLVRELEEEMWRISVFQLREPLDLLWSLSGVHGEPDGRVVRVAGKETEAVKTWLAHALRGIVDVIGEEVYSKAFV